MLSRQRVCRVYILLDTAGHFGDDYLQAVNCIPTNLLAALRPASHCTARYYASSPTFTRTHGHSLPQICCPLMPKFCDQVCDFLDPEGGSQNATLVAVVLVVVISSLKISVKVFLIRSAAQRSFPYTFMLIFSTDLPSQIVKLISN